MRNCLKSFADCLTMGKNVVEFVGDSVKAVRARGPSAKPEI